MGYSLKGQKSDQSLQRMPTMLRVLGSLRIPAMMTADSGERDRVAQSSLTGEGFLLGLVTFRQVGVAGAAHRFTAQLDAMSAV